MRFYIILNDAQRSYRSGSIPVIRSKEKPVRKPFLRVLLYLKTHIKTHFCFAAANLCLSLLGLGGQNVPENFFEGSGGALHILMHFVGVGAQSVHIP